MKTSDLADIPPLEKITLPTSSTPGRMETLGRKMKRGRRRLLGQFGGENSGGQAYHVMSRTAGGEMVFGDTEKEAFRRLMWRMAKFSGVEVLTYAVMGNHFHLLVKVPERAKFLKRFEGEGGEERLLGHLSLLYSKAFLVSLRQELARVREAGREAEVQLILDAFRKRFCDLSCFVKELKERFSRWFNKHHSRRGTLWMDRFKSVLVEDGEALRTMALYIDLNPVRAGLVEDPKDYRWTGYGEACGGSKRARRGLCRVMEAPLDSWEERRGELTPGEAYRCWLFGEGMEAERRGLDASGRLKPALPSKKEGFSKERVEAVLKSGGKLSRADLLRCRVRWFSDGLAIGSKGFVEGVFKGCREFFGTRRKTGARRVREDANGSLHALRELKKTPVGGS
jgi:REP element-mobilizing transposase RayT